MNDRPPGNSPWPDARISIALVAVALVAFITSFLITGPTVEVVRTGTTAPISTSSGQPRTVRLQLAHRDNASYDLNLHFRFRIDVLKTAETIFDVGSPKAAVTISVSKPIDGYRYVVISGPELSAALVNHVEAGQIYTAAVSIGDGGTSITASLNGQHQFSYSYLPTNLLPAPITAVVGGPLRAKSQHGTATIRLYGGIVQEAPLSGAVSGLTLSFRELIMVGSGTAASALRIAAGLAVFAALVLLALRFATGSLVAGRLGISPSSKRESPLWFRWVLAHGALVGILLLVAGIAILDIVTPLDNTVVEQSGSQHLAAGSVGPNQTTSYSMFGETALLESAASLDLHLQFQLLLNGPVSHRNLVYPAVSTSGMQFLVHRSGRTPYLSVSIASYKSLVGPVNLLYAFPVHRWITVSTEVHRSQSTIFTVNGQQIQSYTWNLPILSVAPAGLTIDGTFGGRVRDVTLDVTPFRQQPSRVLYLLIRLAQGLGIVAIVVAVILLSRRFLSKLIPPPSQIRSPLVFVTFWTMGIGVAINIVVDLFHFQVGRSTWLFIQYPRFSDFFQPLELMRSFDPYNLQRGSYPPVGYWILSPLLWLNEYAALFITIALVLGFIVWWISRSFTVGMAIHQRLAIIGVALLSLPVSFTIDRGNIDLIVFVMLVLGIASFEMHRDTMAAVWIGLLGAAKVLPIFYLLLFLRGKKLKYIGLGLCVAGVSTLLAFAGFRSGIGGGIYGYRLALSAAEMGFKQVNGLGTPTYGDASLFGWAQGVGFAVNGVQGDQSIINVLNPFAMPLEVIGALVLICYLRWREGSLWRSVTLITLFFILLNNVPSYYYDLLFLFVPLSLFVKHGTVGRRGIVISFLFGLVFAPRAYFFFGSSLIDFSVLTTAPLLLLLGVMVVYDGCCERANPKAMTDAGTSALALHPGTSDPAINA